MALTAATSKLYPNIERDEDVHLGQGFAMFGDAKLAYDDDTMNTFGALIGTTSIKPNFEKKLIEAGAPLVAVEVEPIRIAQTVDFTFFETSLYKLQKIFGMGTLSNAVSGSVTVTAEKKYLFGDYFHYLSQGYGDVSVSAVDDGGGTPVTYTVDVDYELNTSNGMIRRISTGAITNGQAVYVDYTYTRQKYEILKMGAEKSVNWYPCKFIIPTKEGYRNTLKIWRAVPMEIGEIAYGNEDFTTIKVTFQMLADRTKAPDEMFYKWERETAAYMS